MLDALWTTLQGFGVSSGGVSVAASGTITVVDFSSLVNNDTITVGTLVLTVGGNFVVEGLLTNEETAEEMKNLINSLSAQVTAVRDSLAVQITAVTPGTAGNSIVLQKSLATPAAITLSGPTLTGGQ